MSFLYVVGTPIGNLADITLRALEILKDVDYVACEDTRVTKKLLDHYSINKPLISYHSQSGFYKTEKIISILKEGKSVALVSDAGTPTVSDPGSFLISKAREELGENVSVITIPGPSALTAALSISGFAVSDFLFMGFLPHKKGRDKLFKEISESKRTVVFYESVHRFMATLDKLGAILDPERRVAVCRELTKIYEEVKVGTPIELISYFNENKDKVRGEFVILVEGV